MRKTLTLTLLFNVLAFVSFAQEMDDRRAQRVKAFRIAIFTEALQLTPQEAETFWPVYNAYQEQRETLHKQLQPAARLDALSDAEVEDQVKKHFEMRQRELDLEKDMVQKLRKTIPLRKIAKIPSAERQFRERLLEKVKDNQERRPGGRRGGNK